MCAGNELFYAMLYLIYFYEGPEGIVLSFFYEIDNFIRYF
jgi:hypothetical protein